jgi:hypothetical protein
MRKLKMLWMPVLLGVLLVVTLIGVANARPNARPLEQAWRVLTVPASTCISEQDTYGWAINGPSERLTCKTTWCAFTCPVHFPAAGEQAVGAVNVKRLTLYAHDDTTGGYNFVSGELRKTYPPTGGGVHMANVGTVDSILGFQVVVDTTILNNPVYRVNGPVIHLHVGDSLTAYGFFIHYTW